jgi:formylglycine-generating enzyme required for sulfatase activity
MRQTITRRGISITPALYALMLLLALCLPTNESKANDVQITNLVVHPHSGGNGEVEFDITWQNSWRVATGPGNWDAAWVFCKIRRNNGDWTHLKLVTTGHTIPSTPQAITTSLGLVDTGSAHNASTNPVVGIFMYRTNEGAGTFTANDVRLRWNYADNGASSGDVIDIRVYAIEMVYIPAGAFYAGDNRAWYEFRQKESGDDDPWYITSEDAITTTSGGTGDYYYPGSSSGDAANSVFTIPAAFPKGYGAFYMMKGEFSQGQWVRFFNLLTSTQKSERDITANHATYYGKNTDNLTYRNNVSWTSGDATLPDQGGGATYSGVAMNYLAWADLAAILDWSGLRPMSELEYEKSGRGPIAAVSEEFAWGSTTITQADSISNPGLPSERGQSGSNAAYGYGVEGPLRVGSFAKGVTSRVSSGGGFYGAMELSGNLWERAVTVGNSTGRAFEGRYHGNGLLGVDGNSNVTSWPGTNALGAGVRGGTWWRDQQTCELSYRGHAASTWVTRADGNGGRGVRSAP